MASCTRVIAMEFCYLLLCMEILMDFPAVIAVVVTLCKGNLTDLRRILHLSLAKGNPK
jgi:hypothetical protein